MFDPRASRALAMSPIKRVAFWISQFGFDVARSVRTMMRDTDITDIIRSTPPLPPRRHSGSPPSNALALRKVPKLATI